MTRRDIPAVHAVLALPAVESLCREAGVAYVTDRVREVLADIRAGNQQGEIEERVVAAVRDGMASTLRTVINATGVVLHTNLGRAPLSADAVRAVSHAAAAYTNLEYNLATGARGQRDVHAATLLQQLLGVPAVVVNNNAAAVFLALHELSAGGECIVSRGELVEIGGAFRVPDILARSGAILREVGTTNRTRAADYAGAVGTSTKLMLRVHPSNFRMVGFTERPSLQELVALSKQTEIPLLEDIGSGCFFPLGDEPMVGDSIRAGVDLVTFSCDKLMGGPQAGVIAGRADLVSRVRRNPLFRALRVDKLTYAALGATLKSWAAARLDDVPVARMIRMSVAEVERRARAFAALLPNWQVELVPGESVAGGGSTPGLTLPTTLLALSRAGLSAHELEKKLRAAHPPVIARVEDDRLLIDLRTVFPEQEDILKEVLEAIS